MLKTGKGFWLYITSMVWKEEKKSYANVQDDNMLFDIDLNVSTLHSHHPPFLLLSYWSSCTL